MEKHLTGLKWSHGLVKGTKDPQHILYVVYKIINMVNGASK